MDVMVFTVGMLTFLCNSLMQALLLSVDSWQSCPACLSYVGGLNV